MWYNQSAMPSIVAHAYNLYTQKQKQVDPLESEASLVYNGRSKPTRTT